MQALAIPALAAMQSGPGRPMQLPGVLVPPFVLTRTQTNGQASALGPDDLSTVLYAANVPRFNGVRRALLIEGARTNLFQNSAVGVTQSVTVAAVAHQLHFKGTGSITLSGASTAGPLVGSGANTRVFLAFTPTAASLTMTIAGDVREVQLEAGAMPSSYIETAAASGVRGLDSVTATPAALGIGAAGICTIIGQVQMGAFVAQNRSFLHVGDGTINNRFVLRIPSGGGTVQLLRTLAGAAANVTVGTYTASQPFTYGITIPGDGTALATLSGAASASVAGGPNSGFTAVRLHEAGGGNEPMFGEYRRAVALPQPFDAASLESLVAKLHGAWLASMAAATLLFEDAGALLFETGANLLAFA
jgi:hypothetical protein